MTKAYLALLLCVSSPAIAFDAKLIRVGDKGGSEGGLPSCESLRDFSKIPSPSRRVVERFWKEFALPYEHRDERARRYRGSRDFDSALDAMIASLPAADRDEAVAATLPLAPPAGVCRF